MYLIDDAPQVRDLTRAVIEEDEGLTVVGVAEDMPTALTQVTELQPDVILVDQSLPGVEGVESIPALKQAAQQAAVLLYTGHIMPGLETKAREAGAVGAVEKGGPIGELRKAIHAAGPN